MLCFGDAGLLQPEKAAVRRGKKAVDVRAGSVGARHGVLSSSSEKRQLVSSFQSLDHQQRCPVLDVKYVGWSDILLPQRGLGRCPERP
jgi:hypothetical protein